MMVSWVQQSAFDPPAVSIAVHKDRPIRQALRPAATLALAVVPEGDTSLLKKYARGIPAGEDPFEGIEVVHTPAGLPAPASALAWLECEVIQACDFDGDHDVVIARVLDGALLREGGSFVHLRGNGFHY